jgi:transposase
MYSLDFRRLALKLLKSRSFRAVARLLSVSTSTLHRWQRLGVDLAVSTRFRRRRKLTDAVVSAIREYVADHPCTTLGRLQHHLHVGLGTRLCLRSVSTAVKLSGLSRKHVSTRWGGARRPEYHGEVVQTFCSTALERLRAAGDGKVVLSLDECYFSERVTPLHGYSERGRRCPIDHQASSWKQRSLILAIANNGSWHAEVVMGPVNKQTFARFVLSLPYPKDSTVILDNVAFHHSRLPFVAKGFRPLYTPPYSPEFNPVENAFSKIKGAFRNSWPWQAGVDAALAACIRDLDSKELRNMFGSLQKLAMGIKGSGSRT